MTIASEITALQNNLASAKAAVTTKGGTVGDTGLAGLASEIATIPSGGGGTDWGSVVYDNGNGENTAKIQNANELFTLCDNNGGPAFINNVSIPFNNIKEVELGEAAILLPDYFLYGATGLRSIKGEGNLRQVGHYFLSNAQFSFALNFANLEAVGNYFMSNCTSFNSSLSFPKLVTTGNYFLNQLTSFAQPITMPSTLSAMGNYFMYRCNNFTGPLNCEGPTNPNRITTQAQSFGTNLSSAIMYTTGITLTGPYASDYKSKLPDRTSSPFRKLILGS